MVAGCLVTAATVWDGCSGTGTDGAASSEDGASARSLIAQFRKTLSRADRLGADPGECLSGPAAVSLDPRHIGLTRLNAAVPRARSNKRQPGSLPGSTPLNFAQLWRRRESNTGPARSQESAGARRRVVSGEQSGPCADAGESRSAPENAGESGACSNVASGPTAAELLELVDAAIVALDAGESDVARAQLLALAKAAGLRSRLQAR